MDFFPFICFYIKFSKQPFLVDHRQSLQELHSEASYCVSLISRTKQLFTRKTYLLFLFLSFPVTKSQARTFSHLISIPIST